MSTPARRALLIATSRYRDTGLPDLAASTTDASELATVLADGGIGDFDVETVVDRPSYEIATAVESFMQGCSVRDFLLLYFTGHGVKGVDGNLYFAATNTDATKLRSTALAAAWVNDILDACRSRRQMVLLDCCNSGAFTRGVKSGVQSGMTQQLTGRGRVILTASDAIQFALERSDTENIARSVFTSCVVRGLRTGDADVDGDGRVTHDDLFEYVQDAVHRENPQQTPEMTAVGLSGEFVIARSPRDLGHQLPSGLSGAVVHPNVNVRLRAVEELRVSLVGTGDQRLRQVLYEALRLLGEDRNSRVSAAAREALTGSDVSGPVRPRASDERLRPTSAPAPSGRRAGDERVAVARRPPAPQPARVAGPAADGASGRPATQPLRPAATGPLPVRRHARTPHRDRRRRRLVLATALAALLAVAVVAPLIVDRLEPDEPPPSIADPPELPVDDLQWARISPLPSGETPARIRAFSLHEGRAVAVGQREDADGRLDPFLWTSADGMNWTPVDGDALRHAGDQIAYGAVTGPPGVVAVGVDGTRPDTDAATWLWDGSVVRRGDQTAALTTANREMRAVAWHEDRFVAVGCVDTVVDPVCEDADDGSLRAAVWWSSDGLRWREVPAARIEGAQGALMRDVVSMDGGTLVAIGLERHGGTSTRRAAAWVSGDRGQTWIRSEQISLSAGATQQSMLELAAGDSVVAVGFELVNGDRDATVWHSRDGRSWTQVFRAPEPDHQVMEAVTAAGRGFVAVGRDYPGSSQKRAAIWTSADGTHWTRQLRGDPLGDAYDGTVFRAAFASEDFVLAGGGMGPSRELGRAQVWMATPK